MKRYGVLFLLLMNFSSSLFSQTYALDNSVLLTAAGSTGPDAVTLTWRSYPGTTQYQVYRKLPASAAWGTAIATLTPADTSYTDLTVTNGTVYEYRVDRIAPTIANGYVLSGVNTHLNYNNGIMILLTDSFFVPVLNTEINQLVADYEADGWFVKQVYISRSQSVPSVKARIVTLYNQDPTNTKALMILGHIPVPYSGLINPDGHPDHLGAWPADVFYADMNGTWTDASENDSTSASDPRNHNVPGDGKYDQSLIPSTLELQTGRVDLYNLPAFTATETQLMQKYLHKLHAFKTRGFIPQDAAVIEDNFGGYSEGFSSSGYKNFSAMVGPDNTYTTDWLTTLDTLNALWSYGCGGGWYQGASGIAASTDFAADSVLSVFNMLFGSYFGDWDVQNSFLRSALGSGTMLTNVWAGRPHWQFHQMALGYPIGYSALKTQNNSSTYYTSNLSPGYFGQWVHISLQGDPSLRLHYIAPPSAMAAVEDANHTVHLSWTGSTEIVAGYYVYRKKLTDINWTQLNSSLLAGFMYNDSTLSSGGDYQYMVRAARDQQTASGTYENLSLGSMASMSSTLMSEDIPGTYFSVYPNPAGAYTNIRLAAKSSIDINIYVYNSLGEMIYNTILPAGSQQLILDTETLSPGVYFVQTGGYTCKFIRQ